MKNDVFTVLSSNVRRGARLLMGVDNEDEFELGKVCDEVERHIDLELHH